LRQNCWEYDFWHLNNFSQLKLWTKVVDLLDCRFDRFIIWLWWSHIKSIAYNLTATVMALWWRRMRPVKKRIPVYYSHTLMKAEYLKFLLKIRRISRQMDQNDLQNNRRSAIHTNFTGCEALHSLYLFFFSFGVFLVKSLQRNTSPFQFCSKKFIQLLFKAKT